MRDVLKNSFEKIGIEGAASAAAPGEPLDCRAYLMKRLAEKAHGRLMLGVEEAGELIGLKRSAAFRAAANGSLPAVRLNRRWYVPLVALQELLMGNQ